MARCWAYNRDGIRCELDYEHQDNHEYTVKWTNEECWTPGEVAEKYVIAAPPIPFTPVDLPPPRCFICKHQHANGECKCGCLTSIPE
jgi:hypothetical protein